MLIQDYLDICDPVLTFDRVMGEIELEKYLDNKSKMTQISQYELQKGNWKEKLIKHLEYQISNADEASLKDIV